MDVTMDVTMDVAVDVAGEVAMAVAVAISVVSLYPCSSLYLAISFSMFIHCMNWHSSSSGSYSAYLFPYFDFILFLMSQ